MGKMSFEVFLDMLYRSLPWLAALIFIAILAYIVFDTLREKH